MQKRKHHYIPQLYLREFLDMRVKDPQEPYVWIYDKKEKCQNRRGIRNAGYQTGFYDIKLVDGSITPAVENYFAEKIEGSTAPILKKIINRIPICSEEQYIFSHFLYFTLARVPNFLNYMTWFYKHCEELDLNEESIPSYVKEQIEDASLSQGISTLEFMIEMSRIFAHRIYQMEWQFLSAPIGQFFVTSDNPLILNDPSSKNISPSFSGWDNPK